MLPSVSQPVKCAKAEWLSYAVRQGGLTEHPEPQQSDSAPNPEPCPILATPTVSRAGASAGPSSVCLASQASASPRVSKVLHRWRSLPSTRPAYAEDIVQIVREEFGKSNTRRYSLRNLTPSTPFSAEFNPEPSVSNNLTSDA